jgi:hypothetical protein
MPFHKAIYYLSVYKCIQFNSKQINKHEYYDIYLKLLYIYILYKSNAVIVKIKGKSHELFCNTEQVIGKSYALKYICRVDMCKERLA